MKGQHWLAAGLLAMGCAGILWAQDKPVRPATPSNSKATKAAPPTADAAAGFPVIGHLEKADRILTIKSGPKGAVYSVRDKQGQVLHENLSAEQLRAQAPELHELIKTGVAGETSVKVDASLRGQTR